ncbi:MAG TPA: pseudouridine synthase, partial [Bacteroidales bacterium]|nr:pseudouridine synthase [Bacteroidales bacterium]
RAPRTPRPRREEGREERPFKGGLGRGALRVKGDAFRPDLSPGKRETGRKPTGSRSWDAFSNEAPLLPLREKRSRSEAREEEVQPERKKGPRTGKGRLAANKDKVQGEMRLNQYIARSGICSRREADKLIPSGVIRVNGKVVTELGFKVFPGDKVQMEEQTLRAERMQYVVLNKPKGYLTTMDDPEERRTVMDLVAGACDERIYPVGRLDRNTTGVLLLTNDGEMATRLTHPRHRVKKVYHVTLDKNLTKAHMMQIADGLTLDDGPVKVDAIAWVGEGSDKKEVGVELHSGRNRIVRRIFEQLGYDVIKLDRVMFAGITKKETPRGKWRHLTAAEISILKRM